MDVLLSAIAVAVVLGTILYCCWHHTAEIEREYNACHPPITDEEFVARCSTTISLEVAATVRRTISDAFGIDYERVYPDTNLVKLDNMW